MTKHKVLHLISSNGFYGAENVLLEICLGLRSSSLYEPVVCLLDTGNRGYRPLQHQCQKHGLAHVVFSCRGRYDRILIRELKQFVRANSIRIIHSHGYKSNFYAFFAREAGVQLVTTCHNWIATDFKMRCFTWLDKLLLRFFDTVICVSRPIFQNLKKWRVGNLSIIYNGINTSAFLKNEASRQKIRQHLGLAESDTVIGFVGRVSAEKGICNLLTAMEKIHLTRPNVHLVVVGEGPLRQELQDKGIDYIHFTGVRSDVASFYSSFDLFVLPSLLEGLPMVILEAMAAQLPITASAVGSIPDVIEEGKTGILIDPGNSATLYSALENFLKHPQAAREMGQRAFARVSKEFTAEKMVQQYTAVYTRLFNRKRSPAL